MKKIIGLFIVTAMFAACSESGENEDANTAGADSVADAMPVVYQPVIEASYNGVVPCADCDGIETVVTLFADTSYKLINNYLGKNPNDTAGLNVAKTGKYMMHNDTVHLEGVDFRFVKNDTALIQLDPAGKMITGKLAEKYILKKAK
jgi:uncharacterized lipoprotein NlpE involved in copper resistance